jgi:hypothetical protein
VDFAWIKNIFVLFSMRLCHPRDGSTSPKYKLLCFITTKKICKEKNALAFNRDRCCHLVLCLRLIPFHWASHLKYRYFNIDIPTYELAHADYFNPTNLLIRRLTNTFIHTHTHTQTNTTPHTQPHTRTQAQTQTQT